MTHGTIEDGVSATFLGTVTKHFIESDLGEERFGFWFQVISVSRGSTLSGGSICGSKILVRNCSLFGCP